MKNTTVCSNVRSAPSTVANFSGVSMVSRPRSVEPVAKGKYHSAERKERPATMRLRMDKLAQHVDELKHLGSMIGVSGARVAS